MINDQFRLHENSKWIQVIFNIAFVVIWYLANDGLAFWDDFSYLNFAQQVNQGTFEVTTNHFTSRIALIYPVAQVIDLLGINEYSITVFPMLCTLGVLNVLFFMGRQTNIWIGLIGGFMLICDYHTIVFSTHLFPEMPITLYVLLAIGAYDMINRRVGDHRFLALLTSSSIFAAFLTKTTVFLLIPLFLYLFINDWFFRKRHKSYWLITASTLVFFVLLNFIYYYETTGDFFFRLNNISDNHEATVKTFFDKPALEVIKRLTYLPILGFTKGGFFIPLLFALPSLFSIKKRSWRLDDQKMLWPISILLILVTWWFISTNWKYYSPMPLDTRHIAFLIPLMIVAGSNWWIRTGLFKKVVNAQYGWLIFAPLLAIPAYRIATADVRNFKDLEETFAQKVLPIESKATVFTDGLISYGYPYFFHFEETPLEFEWISETNRSIKKGDYIIVNPAYLNQRYGDQINLEKLRQQAQRVGDLHCESIGAIELCEVR